MGTFETWARRSTLLATAAGWSMRSVESMADRVTDRKTAGGGEVDVGPQRLHGGWGWDQLRAARAEEECGQCSQGRGMGTSSTADDGDDKHQPLNGWSPATLPGRTRKQSDSNWADLILLTRRQALEPWRLLKSNRVQGICGA